MASTKATKFVLTSQTVGELNLRVTTGLTDTNPIILREAIEQLHSRLQHAVPTVALEKVEEAGVSMGRPFPLENRGGIHPLEAGRDSLLEGSAKHHGCPRVFLFPAIEVAMLGAARAGLGTGLISV